MRFEYILLLILSMLPILYKLWYWDAVFRENNNSIQKTLHFLKTQEGREKLFHFWSILELPLFLLSFVVFIDEPFEILLFPAFFYLLLLYNVFVIGKILRKNLEYPSITLYTSFIVWCILLSMSISIYLNNNLVYTAISHLLLFIPLYFIFVIHILQKIWFRDNDQEGHFGK